MTISKIIAIMKLYKELGISTISLDSWTVTSPRAEQMKFLHPVNAFGTVVLMKRKKESTLNTFFFVTEMYEWSYWGGLLLLLLITCLTIYIVEYIENMMKIRLQ